MAGVEIVHIPYNGAAPAMNNSLSSRIPIMFDTLPRLRPLATFACLPSRKEARCNATGCADAERGKSDKFEATAWFGLYMPAANGNAAYTKLVGAVREVLQSAEIKDKFPTQGVEPGMLFGEDFQKFVGAETD